MTCEEVEIVRTTGETTIQNPAKEYEQDCVPSPAPCGINATSITARLTVTEPNGNRYQVTVPLDLYLHGEQYAEIVWLTEAGAKDDLARRLQEACEWENETDENEERHRDRCRILETRIREGTEAAFDAELQQLCDRL